MKKHQTTKFFTTLLPAMSLITIIIFNTGCKKDTTTTGDSKIAYSDLNPDSVILKLQTDTFKLDLNNDGIADFEFHRSRIVLCRDDFMGAIAYGINISLKPTAGSNAIMTTASNLLIDSSKAITPDSPWTTDSVLLLYGGTSASGHCRSSLPAITGQLLNVSDRFVGLKFSKDNNTYYGWARLSSSYSLNPASYIHLIESGEFILKDYAFNNIPNQTILAGQRK